MKSQLLALSLLVGGCATRPYTDSERNYMLVGIGGQLADFGTTAYALNNGAEEGNQMYGSLEAVAVGKVATIGIACALGEVCPDLRKFIWGVTGAGGYVPASWNIYQMEENK